MDHLAYHCERFHDMRDESVCRHCGSALDPILQWELELLTDWHPYTPEAGR